MSTPGIADPYWYEWFVGIEQLIKMLNPDSNIEYVIFQSDVHNTIDDVVVGYLDKREICYQVKHEIGDEGKGNLTFGKLIKKTETVSGGVKESLINSLAVGWKEIKEKEKKTVTPVLYTNRNIGTKSTNRIFNNKKYKALSLTIFMEKINLHLTESETLDDIEIKLEDEDLLLQWTEFKEAIGDESIVIEFLKSLEIRYNEGSLKELEDRMVQSIAESFRCDSIIAENIFDKLCAKLRFWTTTRRNDTKITAEDVYNALAIKNDAEYGYHELPHPTPFFESRKEFAKSIVKTVKEGNSKVIWVYGNPGSGKTSLVSYLQLEYNLFNARYHTFKPISPEQKFYNNDKGLCREDMLWNDLLIQLRNQLKGNLYKYKIPVTNALCTVEVMRREVMRLAGILYEITGQKTVICIDGIDHAARANNEVTFLKNLFRPEEIIDGVVFIIVGQPAKFYEEYPIWLKNETELVKHCALPNLEKNDIVKMISDSKIDFKIENAILANFIYEKTQGNNLSVIYAIEEAKSCIELEDFRRILDLKHVSEDITFYYSHIWKYISEYLNNKSLGIAFPDRLLASLIILLNGRLRIDVLMKAVKIDLMKEDWEELLDLLYPLVQKSNSNEYVLFHNDFRVFLMAHNSDGPKFKSIARQLVDYYMSIEYTSESLVNLIPLMISAGEKERIPKVFDVRYIISSLAYGMSIKNLEEQATLAYKIALELKDWIIFHNLYLAIFTLNQHVNYFEYYDRKYIENDKSYVKTLSPYELRGNNNNQNINIYQDMFLFCKDLLSLGDPISKARAESTYKLWTDNLTPSDLVKLFVSEDEMFSSYTVNETLGIWGSLAAQLNDNYLILNNKNEIKEYTKTQIQALYVFNNSYFEYHLANDDSTAALDIVMNGGVLLKCLKDNLLDIILENKSGNYLKVIEPIVSNNRNPEQYLLMYICLIINNLEIPFVDTNKFEKIKYVVDDTNFKVVLISIIKGYQSVTKELEICINEIDDLVGNIEREDREYNFLKILSKHGFLIGRIINEHRLGLPISISKEMLSDSFKEFLEYERKYNSFNSKNSFRLLLFISLNQKFILEEIPKDYLLIILENHLFNVNHLGMYYKSIILDYLLENGALSLINDYIMTLYGASGENIFTQSDVKEAHENFGEYLKVVQPELFTDINNKLRWDVVGYSGDKEYALLPLLEFLKTILDIDSNEWRNKGLDLYRVSNLVELKGSNRVEWDISTEISKHAAKCGFEAMWDLRKIDKTYRYSLDLIYDELIIFIDEVNDIETLKLCWVMGCGIMSWYNLNDQLNLKGIYFKIISQAERQGCENFELVLEEISPNHSKIILEIEETAYTNKTESEYTVNLNKQLQELKETFQSLSSIEIIDFLILEKDLSYTWSVYEMVWDIISNRDNFDEKVKESFKNLILIKLPKYSWSESGGRELIKKILPYFKEELLWNLASLNIDNFSIGEGLISLKNNMSFLINLFIEEISKSSLEDLFVQELNCHNEWLSGYHHIDIKYDLTPETINLLRPNDFSEYVMNILLDQIASQNIHRIEIALIGIDMLVRLKPDIFEYLSKQWGYLEANQIRFLLFILEKWIIENLKGIKVLYPILLEELAKTNELDKNIQLYLLISKYREINNISSETLQFGEPLDFELTYSDAYEDNKNIISGNIRRFLSTMEIFNDRNNNDITQYLINNTKRVLQRSYGSHIRSGDALLNVDENFDLAMKVIYTEELKKRWSNIPLGYKAQTLLNIDDPWIVSELPSVGLEIIKDLENKLNELSKDGDLTVCKPLLNESLNKGISDEMFLLGGVIWYPFNTKDGLIYTHAKKLILRDNPNRDDQIMNTINSRVFITDLLEGEIPIFEIEHEYFDKNGVSLVNQIVGSSVFVYGNTMLYPSRIIIELLNLRPVDDNPLKWKNSKDEMVMYFERYTNPYRNTQSQDYFRQPLMGRWVCKKEIIGYLIDMYDLELYGVEQFDSMKGIF